MDSFYGVRVRPWLSVLYTCPSMSVKNLKSKKCNLSFWEYEENKPQKNDCRNLINENRRKFHKACHDFKLYHCDSGIVSFESKLNRDSFLRHLLCVCAVPCFLFLLLQFCIIRHGIIVSGLAC